MKQAGRDQGNKEQIVVLCLKTRLSTVSHSILEASRSFL
jgi:hypothetical protein